MTQTTHRSDDVVAAATVAVTLGIARWLEGYFGSDVADRVLSPSGVHMPGVDDGELTVEPAAFDCFEFPSLVQRLHRFNETGEWAGTVTDLEERLHEAGAVADLLRDADFKDAAGWDLCRIDLPAILADGEHPATICYRVVNRADARYALDHSPALTIAQIALLAGVSEKTVRMAANPKLAEALPTFREQNSTYVRPQDAKTWLSRRGFKDAVYRGDRELRIPEFSQLSDLAAFLKAALGWAGLCPQSVSAALTTQLGGRAVDVEALTDGNEPAWLEMYDTRRLATLCAVLGMQGETFVLNAVRLLAPLKARAELRGLAGSVAAAANVSAEVSR